MVLWGVGPLFSDPTVIVRVTNMTGSIVKNHFAYPGFRKPVFPYLTPNYRHYFNYPTLQKSSRRIKTPVQKPCMLCPSIKNSGTPGFNV
jgi:hypothetical protein